MGLFFNREAIKKEVGRLASGLFMRLKENTDKTFSWINYLHKKQQEQDQRIENLERNTADDSEKYKLNYVFSKVREIEKQTFTDAERRKLDYIYAKLHEIDQKGITDLEKQKMNHMFDNYALIINKIKELENKIQTPNQQIDQRMQAIELRLAERKAAISSKDKLIRKVAQNSKEYIKKAILGIIKKYEKISGTQIKEIIVDEQNLCSRSSFYRILDEVEKEDMIKSERDGRDKNYMPLKILR